MNKFEHAESVVMNTYKRFPIIIAKGEGCYVYDDNGKKYLDFVAGIAVNTFGHGYPAVVDAIVKQAKEMLHVSNLYWTQSQIDLADKLVKNSWFDKAFFCNSGAESIEAGLKLIRKYANKTHPERYEIITMKDSFHGRTFGAVTATGQEKYKQGLNPVLPGIKHVPFNDFEALKEAVDEKTAGILLEPIQAEGGVIPGKKEYLQKVREFCTENDIVLMYDEVQCGIGRTGRLFAHQYYDAPPDVMALAKGIAGGVPMGSLLATDKVAIGFEPGDHASTFGGNPLAASVACVVLDELLEKGTMDNVKIQGEYLTKKLLKLKDKNSVITDVRGVGLLQGVQLSVDAGEIIVKCMEQGLLLVNAGSHVIRFVPALNVKSEEIDKCIGILEKVLAS